VIREASGCSIEEPTPIRKTDTSTQCRFDANARLSNPTSVKHIPAGSDQTKGRLSKKSPANG